MTKMKLIAQFAIVLFVASTILSACQTVPSTEQIQNTMNAAVNQTMTAMPTATKIPTAIATPTPSATPTPQPIQYGPTNFPDNVDPLTGLTVADPSILNRRPVMVKVSNIPRSARPHAGLSFADIVFSYYTGPGNSRYLALYYSQDCSQVGSVRSGRYIDRWLVYMYQGILGFDQAWKPELDAIYGQLGDRAITEGPNNSAFYSIGPDNIADPLYVNRVMIDTSKLSQYYASLPDSNNSKPNLDGMAFSSIPPSGGADGHEVTMQYHPTNLENWRYDATTKKYLRWIDSLDDNGNITLIPLVDRDTGQQLAFSNVIIIWAHYQTLNGDDSMHEVSLPGNSGQMLLFRDGQVYQGRWKGVKTDGPIEFFDKDNNPLQLQPGNTWITVTGDISTAVQDQPGVWKVTFYKQND
jgi:Protein of unknown function (DUF3048) C-terminal domain/Protein of unknown function (DUF3048) N-terminal domain